MNATKHILVADDDPFVADSLMRQLRAAGYSCDVVSSGDAALDAIQRQTPDLILLDRRMPRVTGDEVVKRLKANPRTACIPIILVSGGSAEHDELDGLALGADDYLGKPFSPQRLRARVAAILRRHERPRVERPTETTSTPEPARYPVMIGDHRCRLTRREYHLLCLLIGSRGFVINRTALLRMIAECSGGASAALDVDREMEHLRECLGPAAECIQSLGAAGYAFCPPAGCVVRY